MRKDLKHKKYEEIEDKSILQDLAELSDSDRELVEKLIKRLKKED